MKYPREPNSDTVVREDDWNQEAPFGYCPACGSPGIEDPRIAGDRDACFYCSDATCKTIMGSRAPARTKWNQGKPSEILEKEADGWSWNNEYFPGQDLPDVCPD